MADFYFGKMEIIIIIVLALLVAFIIGFNIIQVIDNKLSSVTINVPPQNCQLPKIYLNIDKNNNIKQINLNDTISTTSNESQYYDNTDYTENFGNLNDYPNRQDENVVNIIAGLENSKFGNEIINKPSIIENLKDQNYNTVNNIPLLFSPDPPTPNQASLNSKAYYPERLKLIENQNSPLLKLEIKNMDKINKTVSSCILDQKSKLPKINGPYDGYNSYVDLKMDSYANVTSIGKSMLTPYISYPVPS